MTRFLPRKELCPRPAGGSEEKCVQKPIIGKPLDGWGPTGETPVGPHKPVCEGKEGRGGITSE